MKKIKDGVSVNGLTTEMMIAWDIAESVFKSVGVVECILTSGVEGVHKQGSKHYSGNGIDLRTRNFPVGGTNSPLADTACVRLRERLGAEYQIIKERTHIHIEYDPK